MGTVRLAFSPTPAHVRTARLVAVAAGRQAGADEAVLDEIRLAVGEACSRAVGLHRAYRLTDLVDVELRDDGRFTVTVRDCAPAPAPLGASLPVDAFDPGGGLSEEEVAAGAGLALLTGLTDDVTVGPAPDGPGTVVCISWPLS